MSHQERSTTLVQTKEAPGAGPAMTASTDSAILGLRGGGVPLAGSELSFFEPRFGRSFDNVRVHTGSDADDAARAINARAFTLGSNVAFANGEYLPGSSEGRRLMAHELTHVLQQARATNAARMPPNAVVQRMAAPERKQEDESDAEFEAGGRLEKLPSRVPNNAIGIQWSAGSHLNVFANVSGKSTIMGYRGPIWKHIASRVSSKHMSDLTVGVPGKWRNDAVFKHAPSYIIYREVDAQTAREYAKEIRTRNVGGTYTYSPPKVDSAAHERLAERVGREQALTCSANNCLTVTKADIKKTTGLDLEVRVQAPKGGKAGGSWVTVDISTGKYKSAEGEGFSRRDKGSAARARQFFEGVPDSELEQLGVGKSSPAQGNVKLTLRGASLFLSAPE